MGNAIFRSQFRKLVESACHDFDASALVEHDYLKGRIREIAVHKIIKPFLPVSFGVGTGKIVDSENQQSQECDVIIYDRDILPPILFDPSLGLYPIESTMAVLEIKSRVDATEIKDAIKKATSLRVLKGIPDESISPGQMKAPLFAVLGYSSDLCIEGESESSRYKKYDTNANPLIKAICVIKRGYWCFLPDPTNAWHSRSATTEYDEVTDFVSGLLNTLRTVRKSRGYPKIGPYLVDGSREWSGEIE